MADDLFAPNSDSEKYSDQFSDDLFDGPSECDGSFRTQFNAREVDYVEDSPTPARSTARARGRQTARRLFLSCDSEEEAYRGELLENATATELKRLPPESDTQKLILEELKRTNSRLDSFSDRLEALDCRLRSVEQMQLNMSSSTPSSSINTDDGSAGKSSRKVPAKVAMTVRDVYKTLLDEDENFLGYDTKKRFADNHNQDVVSRLVAEAGRLDCKVPLFQLRAAARRFFQTVVETSALKSSGKYDLKVIQQRRRNRLTRKLEARKCALLKTSSLTDAQRNLWKQVMVKDFMSSEESGEDEQEGERKPVIVIKPLPWRAGRLERFFKQLDKKASKYKSKQSRQQTLPRIVGSVSTRRKPAGFSDDFFAFNQQ